MDEETKAIIAKQTGENDLVLIEKTFYECECDVGATILNLMQFSYSERPKPAATEFDEYRKILDEKDAIFQLRLEKNDIHK